MLHNSNSYHFKLQLLFIFELCFFRAYLKSVAKKLAEDVDNLKTSATSLGKVKCVSNTLEIVAVVTLYHIIVPRSNKSRSGMSVAR